MQAEAWDAAHEKVVAMQQQVVLQKQASGSYSVQDRDG